MTLKPAFDSDFTLELIKNLGLSGQPIRHIVIDCEVHSAIMIYVELFGSEEVLNVEPPNANECRVTILK